MLRDLECTAASVTATATVTVTVTATATVTVTVTVTATVTVTVTVTATVTATATATATATVTATVTVTVTATATVTVTTNNNNNITFINNYNDVGQQIFAVVKSASSCTKTPLCLIHFQLFASQNEFRKFNSLCLSVRLFYSYCYREAFRDISY